MTDKDLQDTFNQAFANHPEARKFTLDYNRYVHLIDDCIDEPKDPEKILELCDLASDIFSSPFYVQYQHILGPVEKMINNTYADSVQWELSEDSWKKDAAKSLRHAGLDMFLIVYRILFGRVYTRTISSCMREYTFTKHLND
jgi:hypothetical protein